MHNRLDTIQRANLAYVEEMYARYRSDPGTVPEEWALFFAGFDFAEGRLGAAHVPGQPSGEVSVWCSIPGAHTAAHIDP
jgi:2-oxoglutarate dehydrogenase complex dehydrogenase (E1) component-like enzyme